MTTIHDICQQATHVSCRCGAHEDTPCNCCPGGVHYSRLARACRAGYVTVEDFASLIRSDVFTSEDVLVDSAEAVA